MILDDKVRNLLERVESWMLANDYECGEVGSELFEEISGVLYQDAIERVEECKAKHNL